jgi:hypothetical protein
MVAYVFDMRFIFVWVGRKGSAHDMCIFLDVIDNSNIKFLKPPKGSYMREIKCYLNYYYG